MSSPGKQPARASVTFSPTTTRHAYSITGGIPSVRSYASSPLRPAGLGGPGPSTLARQAQRGILKQRKGEIRLASTVDEGTRGNQEEARIRLGKRPELKAADSFQLLADKLADSSDASEPPEVTSTTASLVTIILNGADDLLTLEEAYNMLAFRFRQCTTTEADPEILEPFTQDIPGFVRAVSRDVNRLLAPVSSSDSERSSSPCEDRPKRQGYTESEVRSRREASGVGHAALRWLTFMLYFSPLYSMFSIADLTSLLDIVLTIPFTPKIPTPNAKRTYALAIYVLAHLHIPVEAITPLRSRIVDALREAVGEGSISKWGGGPAQDRQAGGNVKARLEGFNAISNILNVYPAVFVPHHRELLPIVLRGLTNSNALTRQRAQQAAAAFVASRLAWLDATAESVEAAHKETGETSREQRITSASAEWVLARKTSTELSAGCLAFLRRKPATGNRETEWVKLDKELKAQMSLDSKWACATWATLVSLLGEKYVKADMYKDINHIMKVTIAAWVKPARLAFARLAWEHAIHAYFQFSSTSHIELGVNIIKYDLDAMLAPARIASILSPVTDALKPITGEVTELKQEWITTLGTQSAAVIYAYSGVLRGGDLTRLDQCYDAVVTPPLNGLLNGNDELKRHGWEILGAITDSSSDITWSIDRLLCARYLDGHIANADSTRDLELAYAAKDESVSPHEIPGWGSTWVATRLSRSLIVAFQRALCSVSTLQDVDGTSWVRSVDGLRIMPRPISDIWRNLLRALMVSRISATNPSPVFVRGIQDITRCIMDFFARAPSDYLPSALVTDPVLIQLGLAQHLVNLAIEECGDAMALTRIEIETPYGADPQGASSPAGSLLSSFLLCKTSPPALSPYLDLLKSTVDVGACGPGANKLLGDLTNRLPWLGDTEALQLGIWRLIASKWCDHLGKASEPGKGRTNHTGLLLVNLLSSPFRDRSETSQWHAAPADEDLEVWRRLLHATVDRSRAKQFGTNGGVLEPLAAHLQDWQDDFKGTSSSISTVACLAEATKCVAFAPQRSNPSPFAIDDSFVPVDFFRLVCAALEKGDLGLLSAVDGMFASLPAAFVPDVLDCFSETLARVLAVDEGDDAERSAKIDSLYMTLLGAIQRGVEGRAIRATSASLIKLEPLWSARLLSAKTPEVLSCFQAFWQATFGAAEVQYPPSTGHFLRQVIKAAPEGWIQAPGLAMESLPDSVPVTETTLVPESDSLPEPMVGEEDAVAAQTATSVQESVESPMAPTESAASSSVPSSTATTPEPADVFHSTAPAVASRKRKRPSSQPLPKRASLCQLPEDDTDEDIGECIVAETPASTPSLLGRVLSGFNSLPTFFSPRRSNPDSQPRRKRKRRSSPGVSPAPSNATTSSRLELCVELPRVQRRAKTDEDSVPETGTKRKREEEIESEQPTPLAARRQLPLQESLSLPSPSKRSKSQQAFIDAITEAERLGPAAATLDQEGLVAALEKVNSLMALVQEGLKSRTREIRRRRRAN